MKLLRTVLLLLLCAMLPVSGFAASGLAGACPMHSTSADESSAAMASADSAMDMQDCMTMSPSHDGKVKHPSCKMSAQCEFGSLYCPVGIPRVEQAAYAVAVSYFVYAHPFAGREPGTLWRPPRAA